MLALDALAIEVITALQRCGVEVLLMKGPVTSQLIFQDAAGHEYTDVDLLVSPASQPTAASVLIGLGFRDFHRGVLAIYQPVQERAWISQTGVVDLHTGLWGIPERHALAAWRTIWDERESFALHGRDVPIIGVRTRLLQLALHAAQRASGEKALTDLRRGVAVHGTAEWQAAADLATAVDATASFTTGLRRLPEGRRLLAALHVDGRPSTSSVLHDRGASPEAMAISRLADATRRQRWRQVRTWLSVEETHLSRSALALTRLKVVARLPTGLVQWWNARAQAGASR